MSDLHDRLLAVSRTVIRVAATAFSAAAIYAFGARDLVAGQLMRNALVLWGVEYLLTLLDESSDHA